MVTPLLHGVSKICEELNIDPLDRSEIDQGGDAFGAYLHQYAHEFDPRVMIAFWVAGVSIPRVLKAVKDYKAKNRKPTPELLAAKRRELQELETQALLSTPPATPGEAN